MLGSRTYRRPRAWRRSRRRSTPRRSTWATRRSSRRSAAGSASRRSPRVRWSPRISRRRSRRFVRSIRSTSISPSRASAAAAARRARCGQASARARRRSSSCSATARLYPLDGTLEFAEVAVDEATGTVTLRAKFPNPDETLLPGMYVRARLDDAIAQDAILAPQQGITRDPKGNATAMVVGADDKVEMRTLVADRAIGDRVARRERAQGRRQADRRRPRTRSARACPCTRPNDPRPAVRKRRLRSTPHQPRGSRMLARFFANRPVFAWVISIVIMLAGVASINVLPVAQYPDVAPPSVNISAYVRRRVGGYRREQRHAGARAAAHRHRRPVVLLELRRPRAGGANINVTFKQGTNPDVAQVQVQNKVQQAIPRLPTAVQQQGIVVTKAQTELPHDRRHLRQDRQGDRLRHRGLPGLDAAGSDRARRRRRRDPDLRRLVRDADLARSAEAVLVRPDAVGYRERGRGAEHPGLGRQDRRATGTGRSATQRDGDRAVASCGPPTSSRTSSSRTIRAARSSISRMSRASSSAPRRTTSRPGSTATPHRVSRCCSRRTRTRSRSRISVKAAVNKLKTSMPRRLGGRVSVRLDEVHPALDRGGREDADRGDPVGRRRDVHLLAELARDVDPGDRGAGRVARHVLRPARSWATRSTR